jgi:hypothetical protein
MSGAITVEFTFKYSFELPSRSTFAAKPETRALVV